MCVRVRVCVRVKCVLEDGARAAFWSAELTVGGEADILEKVIRWFLTESFFLVTENVLT